jgi:hypothetical protein
MTSKVKVELEWDAVESIIVQQISEAREMMISDLKKRKKKNSKNAIFHTNQKKDVKLMQEHIDGFDKVIKYFSVR